MLSIIHNLLAYHVHINILFIIIVSQYFSTTIKISTKIPSTVIVSRFCKITRSSGHCLPGSSTNTLFLIPSCITLCQQWKVAPSPCFFKGPMMLLPAIFQKESNLLALCKLQNTGSYIPHFSKKTHQPIYLLIVHLNRNGFCL